MFFESQIKPSKFRQSEICPRHSNFEPIFPGVHPSILGINSVEGEISENNGRDSSFFGGEGAGSRSPLANLGKNAEKKIRKNEIPRKLGSVLAAMFHVTIEGFYDPRPFSF